MGEPAIAKGEMTNSGTLGGVSDFRPKRVYQLNAQPTLGLT